mmetsp:Transcript_13618/g.20509  ORF Transcript_13618/g.20509 Transcript_13618/m.20509 type:complete len:224 (+) Transcript_13618:79-750(+)
MIFLQIYLHLLLLLLLLRMFINNLQLVFILPMTVMKTPTLINTLYFPTFYLHFSPFFNLFLIFLPNNNTTLVLFSFGFLVNMLHPTFVVISNLVLSSTSSFHLDNAISLFTKIISFIGWIINIPSPQTHPAHFIYLKPSILVFGLCRVLVVFSIFPNTHYPLPTLLTISLIFSLLLSTRCCVFPSNHLLSLTRLLHCLAVVLDFSHKSTTNNCLRYRRLVQVY